MASPSGLRALAWALLASWPFAPGAAAAEPSVVAASGEVLVTCGSNVTTDPYHDGVEAPFGVALGCDRTFSHRGAQGTGVANGHTLLTLRPWAEVTTFGGAKGAIGDHVEYGITGYAQARSQVEYSVRLIELKAPPTLLDPGLGVPTLVQAQGEVNSAPPLEVVQGGVSVAASGSLGEVQVQVTGGVGGTVLEWEAAHSNVGSPHASFAESAVIGLMPGAEARVRIRAWCASDAVVFGRDLPDGDPGYLGTVGAECHAVVDPGFTLDQQTFDERMGDRTYALSDFYAIQYSANLVPEPPMSVLLFAGFLALLARRRTVSRSQAVRS